jgi:hypothetical protein
VKKLIERLAACEYDIALGIHPSDTDQIRNRAFERYARYTAILYVFGRNQ